MEHKFGFYLPSPTFCNPALTICLSTSSYLHPEIKKLRRISFPKWIPYYQFTAIHKLYLYLIVEMNTLITHSDLTIHTGMDGPDGQKKSCKFS